jgi:DNA polymerase III subunit alpha
VDKQFTHIHIHTQYSLLDGAILLQDLVDRCKELGMNACAITDHGSMGGVVDFYKRCKAGGIKPLIGVEAYVTDDPDNKESDLSRDNMHMILLAKDAIGYSRLSELVSAAAFKNFYYKPRICKKNLPYLAGHVVATSACLAGILAAKSNFTLDLQERATSVELTDSAETDLEFYLKTFGEDFYLEVQGWEDGSNYQTLYNNLMVYTGQKKGIPLVITADAHYLTIEDQELHKLLMAMQLKMSLQDYIAKGQLQYGPYFYHADQEEMWKRAKKIGYEEAASNTNTIANKCNVELSLGKFLLPRYPIEQEADYEEFKKT